MCNGLTAEGLASPFVRVTRLWKVVPPSSQHPEHRGEAAAFRASCPPVLGQSHISLSVSIIAQPEDSRNWGNKSGLPAKQGAMKDRMQELRHVSYCLVILNVGRPPNLTRCFGKWLSYKSVSRELGSCAQDALMEQQLWLSGADGGWNVVSLPTAASHSYSFTSRQRWTK